MNKNTFFALLFLMLPFCTEANIVQSEDGKILGKWLSTENNVMVSVYRDGNQFKAKVVWFDDSDDPSQPMKSRLDLNNPIQKLRKQKILGMDVVRNLIFNPQSNRWEDGVIYDANSGKHWSSVAYFNDEGLLEVKGFWKLEFLCKTITFKKVF